MTFLTLYFWLDTFQAHQKMPPVSSLRMPQKLPLEANNFEVSSNEVSSENVNGTDVYGTGLKNEVGEYNCFLNVIIQVCTYFQIFYLYLRATSCSLSNFIFSG